MRTAMLAGLGCLAAGAAHAQRPAISPGLSPEAAAAAFESAVIEGCLPAVAGGRALSQSGGRFALSDDPDTLRQAAAAPGDRVWDVATARGVVTIREAGDRCIVQVYGPPAAPTLMGLAGRLRASGHGFESMAAAGGGLSQTLMRGEGNERVVVSLSGSEPGMTNHPSRFSVVTATVSRPR